VNGDIIVLQGAEFIAG